MTDSEKLDKLIETVSQMQYRFDKMDDRFDKMDDRFDKMDDRFDKMDDRIDKMDIRFDKMDSRLDVIELKVDRTAKKLEDFRLDVAIAERDIRHNIHELKDEMETVIEVLKMNELLPR